MKRTGTKWLKRTGTAAAVMLAAAGLIWTAFQGAAGEWKYELQHRIFQSAEEMYMPGLVYMNRKPSDDMAGWIREKVLAWLPLISYVEDHSVNETVMEDEETIARILESQANDENAVDEKRRAGSESRMNRSRRMKIRRQFGPSSDN